MAETDDDAWLEQLREALASSASGGGDQEADVAPPAADAGTLSAHPWPSAQPAAEAGRDSEPDPEPATSPPTQAVDLQPVLDAIAALTRRVQGLEEAAHELARASRGPEPLDINKVEAAVTRVVRAELPAILDARMNVGLTPLALPSGEESIDQWAERVHLPDAPTGDVVVLIDELRRQIVELEQVHRRALEELTSERRHLIDDAVDEIRKLLFGD